MKHIANILTDEPFEPWELYNIVKLPEELEENIPTLIISWEKTKELYPETSIIEWKITDNVYWTYGKYEKRDRYEENIKKFQDLCVKKVLESITYKFYDVLTNSEARFSAFLNLLKLDNPKTIYVSGDMMYIYIENNPKIIGLSLRDCDYINPSYKKQLFSVVYSSKSIDILKNNENISRETRFKMKGRTYMTPYLFSKTPESHTV